MSQSFANINSFPIELVFGGQGRAEWVWPNIPFRFEPFKGYSRFLRYPGLRDGLGYRAIRVSVIAVLRVKAMWVKPAVFVESSI